MQLLILGGTSFVGRHIVEAALAAPHRVTLFDRGTMDADLVAGCATLVRGDRDVSRRRRFELRSSKPTRSST